MQYGNCMRIENYENIEQGLNRTMQYGNQHTPFPGQATRMKFKSYYVVWKLEEEEKKRQKKTV